MYANKSEAERGKIIGMHISGSKEKEIARRIQCNIKTVRFWIKHYSEKGDNWYKHHRTSNSAPRKTTIQEDNFIIDYSLQNPFASSKHIFGDLGLNLSRSTICRRLNQVNL